MQSKYTPKDIEKFWSKVDKSGGPDACWLWTAGKTTAGYGVIRFGYYGKPRYAHRVSFELAHGSIHGELDVCHKCDNPVCCNPKHLFLGTASDNMKDMRRKNRSAKGFRRWNCKLSDSDVRTIRSRYLTGKVNQNELADEFGVGQDHISRIVNRHCRQYVE